MKTKTLHEGEQALFIELLKIIPLVEKHFKPLDGERVSIQSGMSAKYTKAASAFREECYEVVKADPRRFRIFADGNHLSVWIKADINLSDPDRPGTCNYFNQGFHVGQVDSGSWQGTPATGAFTYEFKPEEFTDTCHKILDTSLEKLESIKDKISQAKKEIDQLLGSVPYQYKSVIE
jgi:hypothetical protein